MNLMNRKEGWKNIRREGECSPFMGGGGIDYVNA